jgi:AcrR family transcriptional regulator
MTYDRERVVAAIRTRYARHGRPPSQVEWDAQALEQPSARTIARRFGWSSLLPEALGDVERRGGRRRKIAMRRQIQRAAAEIVLRQGLNALTVESISDAADISPRTFFNYFRSKDDLFRYIEPPWTVEQFTQAIQARPSDEPPLVALRAVFMELAADLETFRVDVVHWRELARRYPNTFKQGRLNPEVVRGLIAATAKRMRADAGDLEPGVLVNVALAIFGSSTSYWVLTGGEAALVPIVGKAFDLVLAGAVDGVLSTITEGN